MQRYSSMKRKRRKKGSQSVDLQRKIVRAVFIIGAVILLIIFFFGDHGVYQLYNLRQEKAEIQRSIAELRNEKQSLEFEKTRLETDYDYIEKIARERYRMRKPGEKVFKVVPKEE